MLEKTLKSFGVNTKRLYRVMIWTASIILTIVLLLQIAFFSSVLWLNSQSGQNLIKTHIISAAKEAGYDVDFSAIGYRFPQGLNISELKISDDDGPIAELSDVVIRPGIISLGLRNINLSVRADTLTLFRLPASEKAAEPEPKSFALSPFELPDIYFTRFALNNLSIQKLDIRKEVFGLDLVLAPKLESRISLGDIIEADMNFYAQKVDDDLPIWMPKEIELSAAFNPQSLDFELKSLEIYRQDVDISASGAANLGEDGQVEMSAKALLEDFSTLAENTEGNAELNAALKGSIQSPALNANGVIDMPMLKERGLAEIKFTLNDDNVSEPPLGRAVIQTLYQEKPIELGADFNFKDKILSLNNIEGSAPELNLQGQVDFNTDTMLADGNLTVKATDLNIYSQMANIELRGNADADITLAGKDGAQSLSTKANISDAAYQEITLQSAQLNTSIDDVRNPWPESFSLNAKGFKPAADVVFSTVDASLSKKEGELYGLNLNANGTAMQAFSIKGDADLKGLKTGQVSADNIDMTLSSKGSALVVKGMADQEKLNITVNTNGFNLSSLPVSLPEQLHDIKLTSEIKAQGPLANPVIMGDAALTPISVVKDQTVTVSTFGGYQDKRLRFDFTGEGSALDQLDGYIQLPMSLSLMPFEFSLPPSTALDGEIFLKANAGSLAPIFLPAGHKLEGGIDVNGKIGGTIATPDIRGQARLNDGTYFFTPYGVDLYDLNIAAGLTQNGVELETLSANGPKGGKLNGSGIFSFNEKQNTNMNLTLDNFQIADSEKLEGIFSADINLDGDSDGYLLSGDINLGQFDIIIPERFKSNIPELNIVEKDEQKKPKDELKQFKLDLSIIADNQIFVRGWGLDAEFGGEIDVNGTLDSPLFDGDLSARRGRYEEFGRRFVLDQAYLRFQGTIPPSPYLDIIATTDADDIQASVNLSGSIEDPKIKLSSVPSLPEDEILSRVLFGKNIQKITPFQAIQLKQTLDRFTGNGGSGFDPLGKLRDLTGLDDIRVDTDDEGQASVGAGKYLTEDVYLELEKGAGEQSGTANIQVEITPSISLESEVGQDAQAGAGVMWKWDY